MIDFAGLKHQSQLIRADVDERIRAVIDSGCFILGPQVGELEDQLARYCGVNHCITVGSGTDALILALLALGVGSDDEVITSPFSFISAAEAIVLIGAKPVFADIDLGTANIDPSRIEQCVTSRTKAIIPVSLYGQPASMKEINEIAARYGIPVIEDAAQSFGAEYEGLKSCNLSEIGCTSFFPSKPLGCYGDGGAVFCNDTEIANKLRALRIHGQVERYIHEFVGMGARMDTIQCAIVQSKLTVFDKEICDRQLVAGEYETRLREIGVPFISVVHGRTSARAQFTILTNDRIRLARFLKSKGIPTAIHYPTPIHHQKPYAGHAQKADLPNATFLSESVLSLPMHPYLTLSEIGYICDTIGEFTRDTKLGG